LPDCLANKFQASLPASSHLKKGKTMIHHGSVRCAFALFAAAAACTLARADDETHVGLALTGGLSGVGADLGVNINDYVGLRATVGDFSISRTGNYGTSVGWDAKLKLFQAGALVDVYPFAGVFHVSAGIVQDGNKFTLDGKPSGGSYTFNGTTYPASAVSNASASVDWSKAVPYLGLGWGNLAGSRGLHFTADLGALVTGSPNTGLTATCSAPSSAPSVCANFDANVTAERTKLQNDVHNVTFWPVFRLGIGYAF
jgi:hypothetical protein